MPTDRTAQRGVDRLDFPLLGLFGEIGSLLSELKKKQRDTDFSFLVLQIVSFPPALFPQEGLKP